MILLCMGPVINTNCGLYVMFHLKYFVAAYWHLQIVHMIFHMISKSLTVLRTCLHIFYCTIESGAAPISIESLATYILWQWPIDLYIEQSYGKYVRSIEWRMMRLKLTVNIVTQESGWKSISIKGNDTIYPLYYPVSVFMLKYYLKWSQLTNEYWSQATNVLQLIHCWPGQ